MDLYSQVPTEWVSTFKDENGDDHFSCWWPNKPNVCMSTLISSKAEIDKSEWIQIPVEFDKYCCNKLL